MRFCGYCGAPVVSGANFCVECGRELRPRRAGWIRNLHFTGAFVGVFLGILIVGLVIVRLIVTVPAGPPATRLASSAPGPQPEPQAGAENLPPGHPSIQLPAEARSFIDQVDKEARARPSDLAAWNKLGDVSLRAALLDASYYAKAEEAYGHALKLDPDSPDALRGIGNLNYDHKNYDQAIAAYEHYLKRRPDDPEVCTDLGTMYLYTGNPDQAAVQYKRAIKVKPDFFEGYYNLGIAYGEQNDARNARQAFSKALSLAPDDASRSKVKEMLAKLNGEQTPLAGGAAGGADQAQAEAPTTGTAASSGADSGSAAGNFQGAIEQMVRNLPIAGSKVSWVKWPDKLKATVMMDNFPIDQMPPFAKQQFLNDLKNKIKTVKESHKVSGPVELDIADGASGRVMETVTR